MQFLVKNGAKLSTYKLTLINDNVVGKYCDFLEKKNGSNYTYNSKIKAMRTFFNYLIDKEDYDMKNVWKKVKLKSERPTDISMSEKDFYDLLEVISPDDALTQIGKTRRNMYRPWLKDLIKLKAFTGRRNAELFEMRWNMIRYEDDMPVYIESPNIKVNKQQNNFDERDFQYAYIPVGEELLELLIDLKLDENYDSHEYIIAPEVENRHNLEKYTSKYFTFFFKKLNRNYTIQLKHLRQTYITREDLFVNTKISMQHSNYRTTSKHYIDKREVAKQMVTNGFRIFSKKNKKCTPVVHSTHKKRSYVVVTP
jgi:integrase